MIRTRESRPTETSGAASLPVPLVEDSTVDDLSSMRQDDAGSETPVVSAVKTAPNELPPSRLIRLGGPDHERPDQISGQFMAQAKSDTI